jgi:hypothetical protein
MVDSAILSTSDGVILIEQSDHAEGWRLRDMEPMGLDCPLQDGEYETLVATRYGYANDEVPPRSIPETGGKCFMWWVSDLAECWDELTAEQQNQAYVIALNVFPEGNELHAELSARL